MYATNVSAAAVQEQYNNSKLPTETTQTQKTNEDYKTKYLAVSLEEGETQKGFYFRLLPIYPGANTPFMLVYAHKIRVSREVSKTGFKTIICPAKNQHQFENHDCPFCNKASEATSKKRALWQELSNSGLTKEAIKKNEAYDKLNNEEFNYTAKPMWICRGIVRGKEAEGPKWWMFSHQEKKRDGYMDALNAIDRAKKAMKQDPSYTIYDLNRGCDLYFDITQTFSNGKKGQKISIIAAEQESPLCADEALGNKWINEECDWVKRYSYKPLDYMQILANGGVPTWDNNARCYVDKAPKSVAQSTNAQAQNPQTGMPVQNTQPTPAAQPSAPQTQGMPFHTTWQTPNPYETQQNTYGQQGGVNPSNPYNQGMERLPL